MMKRKRPAAASKRKAATRLHPFNDADDPPPRQRETRPPDRQAKYATASQVRLRYGGRSQMWLDRILKHDADFPRFIKIGRFRFFDIAQLETYEAGRAARCAPQPTSRGDGHEQSPQVQTEQRAAELRCSKCGATAQASCDVAYGPAIEIATKAVNSNRLIAPEFGVGLGTVNRARNATEPNGLVDQLIEARKGKSRGIFENAAAPASKSDIRRT
jgi:hypothetical protein